MSFFNIFNKKRIVIDTESDLTPEEERKIEENFETTKKWKENSKQYKKYWTRHYEILEKVQFDLYSKAINQPNIFNKYSEMCINLCLEDLSLAPYLIEYWTKENEILNNGFTLPNFGSHKYLLKILEKQKRYDEAIMLCNQYIELGLDNDGTKGGIKGRKEKFKKLILDSEKRK